MLETPKDFRNSIHDSLTTKYPGEIKVLQKQLAYYTAKKRALLHFLSDSVAIPLFENLPRVFVPTIFRLIVFGGFMG